ncbi:uncharacterized protein LOC132728449 [Ruditapes philippinarum]|uniref:uncharacterized protein LOC132728449 n=1 Tax=Ruditapes philippinarum TaxID=129788 RepID=UPI00295B69A2|nr:uncharacterized protein LOC132728449 [Ruditapes philippinarum]XP_060570075.1 uncharacterized protein LOC132728449 [Ruditapes philippinarum]
MEDISLFVSRAMDNIGYGSNMVNLRRKLWQKYALQENKMKYHKSGRHLIIAGSKAEGVSAVYESDIDHMYVLTDVVCVQDADDHSTSDVTCFQRDDRNAPPGYTQLKLINFKRGRNSKIIHKALFEDSDNNKYISSACFMEEQRNEIKKRQSLLPQQNAVSYGKTSGPALPLSTGDLKADIVTGFVCQHPNELKAWLKRHHDYGWPNSGVIENIRVSSENCELVPIGCRDNESNFKEWRLCFINTEVKLVQSFNSTQIKHYVLLKLIAKDILKTVSDEITSFIMKNVCFWLAEILPYTVFREQKLLEIVLFSLTFLKYCLSKWNFLPYYIIPDRNLFYGKFSFGKRQKIVGLLEKLDKEGPQLLLRCAKLRIAMLVLYKAPDQLCVYSKNRDEVEILKLRHIIAAIAREYGVKNDDVCDKLRCKMADIVFPDWKLMSHEGIAVNDTIIERVYQMLS